MIAAHPEGDRCRRVVDEYSTDIGLPGEKIIGELAGLWIEPGHPIGPHGAGPDVTVLVRHDVVRRTPGYRHFPFLDHFGSGELNKMPLARIQRTRADSCASNLRRGREAGVTVEYTLNSLVFASILPDVIRAELQQIEVVVLIGWNAVGTDGSVCAGI